MKILFAASECVPFCKTGGLADVVGALPKALKRERHDVRIIIPKYKQIRAQEFGIKDTGKSIRIPIGDKEFIAEIKTCKTEQGIPVYFISSEDYFTRPGLYRDATGDFVDNDIRFSFFSRAVFEACKLLSFQPDIIHAHDWQTGLIPAYLKTLYSQDPFFKKTATLFTIHNIAYQGIFPKTRLPLTGLGWSEFTMDKLEFYDSICFLKAGLAYADGLTTVSPTYAAQIQSGYEYGRGMEGLLQKRSSVLRGILNGIDIQEWDPYTDVFLPQNFDLNHMQIRRLCKRALQRSLNLPDNSEAPLLGVVARMDQQKGMDLVLEALPEWVARGFQLVILGQGDIQLQRRFELMQNNHPLSIRYYSDFNEPLAHQIYAGSDFFLMPSRFEPCGLSQMIAMRYGSIPIVSATGGLLDTVQQTHSPDTGTGFFFNELTATALIATLNYALQYYANPTAWQALQARAMSAVFSWSNSAIVYLQAYRKASPRAALQPTRRMKRFSV